MKLAVALAVAALLLPAARAEAAGEGVVSTAGAPAPNQGTNRAIDVATDSAGRIWFAGLDRVVAPGSAADRTCGGAHDGAACGRIGRISPNGSVRYFKGPGNVMESPVAVAVYGQTAFVADRTAHTIWRVRNGDNTAVEVAPVYQHSVIAPSDLLVRGTTVWFLGSADTAGNINLDSAERFGRIGRFDVRNPGRIEVWPVNGLRDLSGLTADNNGNLWVTGNGIHRQRPPAGPAGDTDVGVGFARINPNNPGGTQQLFRQSQFAGDDYISAPSEVITGPDGLIWFVDNGTSQVGRFAPGNPVGTLEFFDDRCDGAGAPPPPDPDNVIRCGGRIFDLVRGPDGAVWYSRTRESEMGRITIAGDLSSSAPAIPGFAAPWALARQPARPGQPARIVVTMPGSAAIGWFRP